jgi:ubiquinone/menaquinone biosynthesis C-methylase UbiE
MNAFGTTKRPYRAIARWYDLLDLPFEYFRYKKIRPTLFEGVAGRGLDVGVGTGRNMPFYPPGARMTGIDLSPAMLARAERRRRTLGVDVELAERDALATGFADDSFDFVVATFLFCVLEPEDQRPALRELARICKPEGEIRILEYTLSADPRRRFVMRLMAPWVRLAYGAAFDRETERYVPDAGLDLIERRFLFKDVIKLLILKRK